MKNVLYLHGFLSSPQSHKAQLTQAWLTKNHPQIHYLCPELSAYPSQAITKLHKLCDTLDAANTFLIGSSLGGFWATYLLENGLAAKAVVVNPAVNPNHRFTSLIDTRLTSYYSDDEYQLKHSDLDDLASCAFTSLKKPSAYWLLAQTGDETLDYRHAVNYYQGAMHTIEQGGHHSFTGFERYLPKIMKFFQID